jgi:hypothetical protein
MRIRIEYAIGGYLTIAAIDCVESIQLVGLDSFLIKTFGNEPVLYKGVLNLDIITWAIL